MENKAELSLSDDLTIMKEYAELTLEEITEELAELTLGTEEEETEESVAELTFNESKTVAAPKYLDDNGNDVKLSRSITSNIIQSDETVKSYYSELKNHILSYRDVKSRISWKFDTYTKGGDTLFKIKLRGKTICLYCNLNPEEFDKSQYNHEAIDSLIFKDVPMLVKIKSDLSLRKAKDLVDIEMTKYNVKKLSNPQTVDYVLEYPYQDDETLIKRGLIKALVPNDLSNGQNNKTEEINKSVNVTTVRYKDGAIYEGEMYNGKRHGKGKLTIYNKDVYEGYFSNDKYHGKGKYISTKGFVVEGNFVNGSFTGKGKVIHENGRIDEGDFVDGVLNETLDRKEPEKSTHKNVFQKIFDIFKKK